MPSVISCFLPYEPTGTLEILAQIWVLYAYKIEGSWGCMLNQLLCFTFFPYFFRNKEGKQGKYFRCGGRKKKKKGGGGGRREVC